MASAGKRIKEAQSKVDSEKLYELKEAVDTLVSLPKAKFDETVELSIKLGVDPRKAEENIRSTVALPHGTGKTVRVVVFCKADKAEDAKNAGADEVGAEDLAQKVQGGWMDFDAVVASPDCMAIVGKLGKVLGPRGLMPNPKVGTVTPDVASAVKAIKSGRVEFRVEKNGIIHCGCGKLSFGPQQIKENLDTLIDAIVKAKPKTSKGIYLQSAYISSTMGPSIQLDPVPFR